MTRRERRTSLLMTLATLATLATPAYAQRAAPHDLEIRLLTHQALVRSALGALVTTERSVALYGAELTIPTGWAPLRIEARVLRSSHGEADLRSRDFGLVLAGQGADISAGLAVAYADRGSYAPESGLLHRRTTGFGRAGARLQLRLPEAAFLLHLNADLYMPLRASTDSTANLKGWEASSGLTYRFAPLPFTATLGYRIERFRVFGLEQEVSALTFALGYVIRGH